MLLPWLRSRQRLSALHATKSVATAASKAVTATAVATKSASHAKSVHHVKNVLLANHVKSAHPAKKLRLLLKHLAKSAHRVHLVKNAHHAHHVKTVNLVAKAVKSAYANCASLWTQRLPWLPQL